MLTRLCLAAALAAAASAPAAAQVADETQVPRMTVAAFKQALDAGRVLPVDVRDPVSFAEGHIPGAVNVQLGEYQRHLPSLRDPRKLVVAYCS